MNKTIIDEIIYNIKLIKNIEELKSTSTKREVVFLCVGNSKVWFDSFGPMIGSFLQYIGVNNYIYGTIRSNINKDNINQYIDSIYKFHANPYIVVVDNLISTGNKFTIKIKTEGLTCSCFNENSVYVGDLSVLCSTPANFIKSNKYYKNMLYEVKKFGVYIKEYYL